MIGTAIRSILLGDAAIVALIVDRVYPLILPQHSKFPCISYRYSADRAEITFDGQGDYQQIQVELDCWAMDYDEMTALSKATQERVKNFEGVVSGVDINKIYIDSTVPVFEELAEVYRETILLAVHVR